MNKFQKIIFLFCLSFISSNVFSQDDEFPGGSPYTIFGIGDLKYNTSLRTNAMGVQGIGLLGNYVNNMNPAANIFLDYTKFSVTADYGLLKSTNDISELKVSEGNVTGMNIGIPFSRTNGWVMNLGINPISLIGYKISQSGVQDGQSFNKIYSGKGSLTSVSLGMSYIVFKAIGLAAEYNYAFGNIKDESRVVFNNPLITNTRIRSENDLRGSFFKAGAVLFAENITSDKNLKNLTLGFSFHSKASLTSSVDAIYSSSVGEDTVRFERGTFEIPYQLGFGISNKFSDRYVVAADLIIQNWANFREFGISDPTYGTSYRAGLGFEIQPSKDDRKSMWEKLTYRFGGYYDKAYYEVLGNSITRFGISAGIEIPISELNSIDFNVNYSTRGKTDFGLVKDQSINFGIGLNFGEIWFIKRRIE
ncbi:MAG TPA: hypothetical protein DEP28_10790 [Bacteroidetes bacterium]|nr:hypothetical protein [Bacteroidota bacterium]HCN38137.1 hypothetical protein [Bacteroidota bacterium]